MLTAAIVWEEQGYSGCSGPGFSLHSDIVIPYILHYGTEEQKMKFVPKLCKGEWVGALGMTEPGAGSDLQGMRTTAEPKGDHYVLNGSKVFITNGAHSDVVVVGECAACRSIYLYLWVSFVMFWIALFSRFTLCRNVIIVSGKNRSGQRS